jgi:hypothetical protein
MSRPIGPYKDATVNMDRNTHLENATSEVGKNLLEQEVNFFAEIAKGDDASATLKDGTTITGENAVAYLKEKYQRAQRIFATLQELLQSRHQMLMGVIRNIGK